MVTETPIFQSWLPTRWQILFQRWCNSLSHPTCSSRILPFPSQKVGSNSPFLESRQFCAFLVTNKMGKIASFKKKNSWMISKDESWKSIHLILAHFYQSSKSPCKLQLLGDYCAMKKSKEVYSEKSPGQVVWIHG